MHLRSFAALVFAFALHASTAKAYNFASSLSVGCHEEISLDALEQAGWPEDAQVTPIEGSLSAIERDLPFQVDGTTHDAWTLGLVLGVRYNDLHGHAATDFVALSDVHGDNDDQREHCLRAGEDDGEQGNALAIAQCREFIIEQVEAALGQGDVIDSDARQSVPVSLAYSRKQDLDLVAFAFHFGRALHALQDSFTHTFRSEDHLHVRHVLNFVEWARDEDDYDEARDGYRHLSPLDDCAVSTTAARTRREAATLATRAMFDAVRDPSGGRAMRLSRVQAVLDQYLSIEPGCTETNDYCDAPERFETGRSLCAVNAAGAQTRSAAGWMMVIACGALMLRRRARGALSLAFAFALLSHAVAYADEPAPQEPVAEAPASIDHRWGLLTTVSAALDHGAFAARVAGRYRATSLVEVGLDAEYNPWYSLEAFTVIPGAMNFSFATIFHWARFDKFELRTTLSVGVSVLLEDLVTARAGSVGPYLGVSLLGLSYAITDHLKLIVDPADVALPVPHVTGVPLIYQQYRFTIGVQWLF